MAERPDDEVAPGRSRPIVPEPVQRRVDKTVEAARRGQASAYSGAVEAVLAIVVAALIGMWVDSLRGTGPTGLMIGTAVGFAAFVLRLFRLRPPDDTPDRPEAPQRDPSDDPD